MGLLIKLCVLIIIPVIRRQLITDLQKNRMKNILFSVLTVVGTEGQVRFLKAVMEK